MIKICKFCEKEFSTDSKIAKYCKAKCRSDYGHRKHRKIPTETTCIHCGVKFSKKANKHNSCASCKEKKTRGLKPDMHTEITVRDNTELENELINAFLCKNNEG